MYGGVQNSFSPLMRVCVCVRERERVCVREGNTVCERGRMCVCVSEGGGHRVCACVFQRERERERGTQCVMCVSV